VRDEAGCGGGIRDMSETRIAVANGRLTACGLASRRRAVARHVKLGVRCYVGVSWNGFGRAVVSTRLGSTGPVVVRLAELAI
jgi:hypothetical protein